LVSKQAMLENIRRSSYQPIYAQELIEWMRKGRRFKTFAGSIGVSTKTIEEWAEIHEEFATAREIGEAASLAFWDQEFTAKATGSEDLDVDPKTGEERRRGQGHWEAMKFTAKNAHPEDFKEKVEVGHTGGLSFVVDTGIDRRPLVEIGGEAREITERSETVNEIGPPAPMEETPEALPAPVKGGRLL